MGQCNDCGATVKDIASIADHYEKTHPGMPRYRFWDGTKETVTCPECGIDVTPIPHQVQGDGRVSMEWDYLVHLEQEKNKELRGLGHHGGEK